MLFSVVLLRYKRQGKEAGRGQGKTRMVVDNNLESQGKLENIRGCAKRNMQCCSA